MRSDRNLDPDSIYFDYKISGEEGLEDVTIHIQFRAGGPNGKTIVLTPPSSVNLDGQPFHLDSTEFTGAYYEIQKRKDSIIGKHSIVFTDRNGKKYREEFEFTPFMLNPDVADTLVRDDLIFNFTGLDANDKLLVVLTDTSFHSEDINDMETVTNGRLLLSRRRLSYLYTGPIYLEFIKEEEHRVRSGTKKGGFITITYGLKRQLELKESL